MKKILFIFCGIAAVFFVTLGCSAESSDVLTVTPTVNGNILKYSVETEFNTDGVWIFSALYDGEVLSDVRVNTLNGEFEMQPDREYELKVFTWEKDSMKPISNVVSFEGLKSGGEKMDFEPFTRNTKISDVMSDPAFDGYGRLIFPVNTSYWSGDTLEDLRLTWYNYINPDKTVEIVNYMKENALKGNTIFYDIYSDAEKAADSAKRDTGLFFFRGDKNAKTAICNAGGGFSYVGAMHDSFPHALELSKMGYNAFALIYRPGWDTAMEDLARAIAFIHDHAAELEIDVEDYSLWGGSAGARMVADLGSYGTECYGEAAYPRAGAVIMQYTGHSEVTGSEPPTYNCVGTNDGIASYRTMENRIERIKANGTDAMIEVFDGLPHGFGLGQGTVAEGWINNAVAFWERNMK